MDFFHFYGVHWQTGDTLAKWIFHNRRPSKVLLGVSTKHHLMKSGKWIETIWAAFIDICNNQRQNRARLTADYLFTTSRTHSRDLAFRAVHIRGNRNEQGKDGHKHYGPGCRRSDSRPDAFGQRSSTSLVSFHGPNVSTAAAFSHFICVVHTKAAPYTCLSVLSLHSGTPGEDQAPSEPFSGLSKQIEGLQHLKARPRVSPSRFWLVSVLKRSQLGDWLQSILQHENLCKETARCEARKSCIASQRETDRKTGPPPSSTTSCPGCYGNGICM